MKKGWYWLFLGCIFFSFKVSAQYDIQVQVKNMAGQKAILAYYFEDKVNVQDTVILDGSGKGHFRHDNQRLARGLYMLYLTPTLNLEMIIGDDQHFSLSCDTTNLLETARIEGSAENAAFLDFQKEVRKRNLKSRSLMEEYNQDPQKEKEEIRKKYTARNEEIAREYKQYVEELSKRFPGSALETFARFTLPPEEGPDFSKEVPEGTKDRDMEIRRRSWYYQKSHYWDQVNLQDSTLIRTNMFKKYVENYFENMVMVHPDSLYQACVEIIEKSRPCPLMFKYLTEFCLVYAFDNKIMGMDEAFVKLGDRYYLSGQAYWASQKQMKTVTEEVYKRRYNLLYHQGADLKFPTLEGNWVRLYETKAPFILVLFWEPSCGNCKKQVPLVKKEIYDRFHPYGLEVFAVNIHSNRKEWEDFIEKHQIFDFINCWDETRQVEYRTYYNVFATPVMYILDKDKKFICKNLAVDQMVDLLKREYKKQGIDIP